jgi:hypothetical protein
MKEERFQPIKERFRKRLNDWSENMHLGAEEAFIKSVAKL